MIFEGSVILPTTIKRVQQITLEQYLSSGYIKAARQPTNGTKHLCKQAIWLAPTLPACTPNSHIKYDIMYFKQTSITNDSIWNLLWRLISMTKSRIPSMTQFRRAGIINSQDNVVYEGITFNQNMFSCHFILNECINILWPIGKWLIITSPCLLARPLHYFSSHQYGTWWRQRCQSQWQHQRQGDRGLQEH